MSSGVILIIFFGIMLITLFLGTPVSMSLGFAGMLGVLIWVGSRQLVQLGVITYTQGTHMNQLILPMFIMMSEFLSQGRIAEDIFSVLNRGVGRFKGGLAIATTLACTVFAALCGSSPATAASIGKISISEMTKRGYSPSFAVGTVAAGGTLGIMIPPSLTFCIYASITETSIVRLFMAGLVPGLMLSALLIVSIMIRTRLNPALLNYVPAGQAKSGADIDFAEAKDIVKTAKAIATGKTDSGKKEDGVAIRFRPMTAEEKGKNKTALVLLIVGLAGLLFTVLSMSNVFSGAGLEYVYMPRQMPSGFAVVTILVAIISVVLFILGARGLMRIRSARKQYDTPDFFSILPAFGLILIVLGSMYFGFATPIEAAGYGVVGAAVILLAQRRLTKGILAATIKGASRTGSMMIFLVICGTCMTFVVSYLGIPQEISRAIASSGLNKYVVLLLMYLLWFILGALMDPTSMVLLTIPFLFSTIVSLGFDPYWLGVVLVLGSQIAMMTPPVGMNLFVLKANTDIPMSQIISGSLPYVGILMLGLLIITVFPGIALWLPSLMF